jgi:NADH-quinone oxidoreductase subunit H
MSDHAFRLPAIILFGALGLAGILVWLERRILAIWQDRLGPNRVGPFGAFQLGADMIKLIMKEDWVAPFADRAAFVMSPSIMVASVMAPLAVVAFAPGLVVADLDIGLLFFLGMSSLAVYGAALAGWASNSKYSLLGGLRAMGQMVSYEVFMGLSLMGVVILSGSFRLSAIVEAQKGLWYCVPQFPGLLLFLVAASAEMRRTPFDLPEAESELVAGYHSEYSGMKFALFYFSEYVGMILLSMFITLLFFGGWLGPSILPPVAWFSIKTAVLIVFFVLVRATLPRLRYDQLMSLGWKVMLPLSLVNLLVTGAIVLAVAPGAGR